MLPGSIDPDVPDSLIRLLATTAVAVGLVMAVPVTLEAISCHEQCDNGAQMMYDAGFSNHAIQNYWHNCHDSC